MGIWEGVLSIYLDTVKAILFYYYRISRGLYIWCFFFHLSKNFAETLGFSNEFGDAVFLFLRS